MQIENLAAVVHAIAKSCGAKTVVDVGSGQVRHMHANSCNCNQVSSGQNYISNTWTLGI